MKRYLTTPLGTLIVNGTAALVSIEFSDAPCHSEASEADDAAAEQLREYFAGRRTEFDLELEPAGTEFQRKVWQEVHAIPFGETRSYLEIATALGDPNLARAVGAANGANPIPIVIPCHRVVGAGGGLTGYLGGVQRKRWLLEHESSQGRLEF